jgi:gliding motility-associated protein GldM
MALPKEPRQKMINLMYLVLTALLALNVSSEILNAFKVVDDSLQKSNTNFSKSSKVLIDYINDSKSDPGLRVKAEYWAPKAQQIQDITKKMYDYIEGLKKELKTEAGFNPAGPQNEDGSDKFKEDDLEAATRLFSSEGTGKKKGQEMLAKLKEFKAAILAVDSVIARGMSANFPMAIDDQVKAKDGTMKSFENIYFHMTPTVAALTLLSKFENDVKNVENKALNLCAEQLGKVKIKFDKFAALVGQSSNYVMPGQTIDITAGLGAYSSDVVPTVTIGGSSVPIGPDGKALKTIPVSGSGEQSVNVTVKYKDQDGKDQVVNQVVKYTVGTPGVAAVMADKMNVFYYGVDNPITIGSPSGWDKTTVSGSGCSLSGSNANRIVRPSAIGQNATISVTADGKKGDFTFRVKRIPDPVFKVGSGKTRLPSVEMKSQSYCRADMGDGFDFDLRFNVVSATVYFSGAGFPNVVSKQINGNSLSAISGELSRCMPGSAVTFDNIKVQGPDGVRTIESKAYTLY